MVVRNTYIQSIIYVHICRYLVAQFLKLECKGPPTSLQDKNVKLFLEKRMDLYKLKHSLDIQSHAKLQNICRNLHHVEMLN